MTFCALSSAKGMNIKMKIGFNEATALECKGQSLIADLEACEKYGLVDSSIVNCLKGRRKSCKGYKFQYC